MCSSFFTIYRQAVKNQGWEKSGKPERVNLRTISQKKLRKKIDILTEFTTTKRAKSNIICSGSCSTSIMTSLNTSNRLDAIEMNQMNELFDLDDWSSSWKYCIDNNIKWGGRAFGGRAAGRHTMQAKDIVIEGCTMAYLGYNLLNRCTIRLINKKRYGLIGRNGVGKR